MYRHAHHHESVMVQQSECFDQHDEVSVTSSAAAYSSFLKNYDSNLVDPASSHTLVSKIKPCMSKYKQFCTVKLRMAHYISYSLLDSTLLLG